MEALPVIVLQSIIKWTDVRDQFRFMSVSRAWFSACRSVIREKKSLTLDRGWICKESPTTFWCKKRMTDEHERLMWRGFQDMHSLQLLDLSNDFTSTWMAVPLIKLCAPRLRVLRLDFDDLFDNMNMTSDVSMPLLQEIVGVRVKDLHLLLQNSRELRIIRILIQFLDDDMLRACSRLKHLQELTFAVTHHTSATVSGIISLLRGPCRASVEKMRICVEDHYSDQLQQQLDSELDQMEGEAGRRLKLETRWNLTDYSSAFDSSDSESSD